MLVVGSFELQSPARLGHSVADLVIRDIVVSWHLRDQVGLLTESQMMQESGDAQRLRLGSLIDDQVEVAPRRRRLVVEPPRLVDCDELIDHSAAVAKATRWPASRDPDRQAHGQCFCRCREGRGRTSHLISQVTSSDAQCRGSRRRQVLAERVAQPGISTSLLAQELQHCQHPPVLALTWRQPKLGEHVAYVPLDGLDTHEELLGQSGVG